MELTGGNLKFNAPVLLGTGQLESLKSEDIKAGVIEDVQEVLDADYVSKEELSSCGYLTQHQSLANYATHQYVTETVNAVLGDLENYDDSEIQNRLDVLESIDHSIYEVKMPFESMYMRSEHLYEIYYNEIDWEYAAEHLGGEINLGGCSAVYHNGTLGRNLDWLYDNAIDFIVRTRGERAVMGVANKASITTDTLMDSVDDYKLLPFYLQDGINSSGLVAEMNVVPLESTIMGVNNASVPAVQNRETVNGIMLVRYMLDNFDTAQDAAEYIRDYVSVTMPEALHAQDYELHYMVADADSSYVIEIVNGEIKIVESDISTNFYLYGVNFNDDGHVNSMQPIESIEYNPVAVNNITPYGAGIERYNMLRECVDGGEGDVLDWMRYVWYRQGTYNTELYGWYSEFVNHVHSNTLETPIDDVDFNDMIARVENAAHRDDRQGVSWITTHTVVYDTNDLSMTIIPQEGSEGAAEYYRLLNEKVAGVETSEYDDTELRDRIAYLENAGFISEFNEEYLDGFVDAKLLPYETAQEAHSYVNSQGFLKQHQSLSNYYTKSQVDEEIANAVTGGALDNFVQRPELTAYATKTWVEGKNYLTSHQSLSNYYNKSQVDAAIADAVVGVDGALDDYALKTYVNTQDEAVKTWANGQFLTSHQSLANYYVKSEVDAAIAYAVVGSEEALSEYALKTYVNTQDDAVKSWVNGRNFVTASELMAYDYASKNYLAGWLDAYLEENPITPDLSGYATQSELEDYMPLTGGTLTGQITVNTGFDPMPPYSLKNVAAFKIKHPMSIAGSTGKILAVLQRHDNDSDFVAIGGESYEPLWFRRQTSNSSSSYYKLLLPDIETHKGEQRIATLSDLSSYATLTYVNEAIAAIEPAEYDDTALAARVSTLEAIDHSQYITSHQDLSAYASYAYVSKFNDTLKTVNVFPNDDANMKYVLNTTLKQAVSYVWNSYITPITTDLSEVESRIDSLEAIDHSQYITSHQALDRVVIKDTRDETILPQNGTVGPYDKQLKLFFTDEDTPNNGWMNCLWMKGWGGNYIATEIATPGFSSGTSCPNDLYYRNGKGDTWQPWEKVATYSYVASVVGDINTILESI